MRFVNIQITVVVMMSRVKESRGQSAFKEKSPHF